MHTCLHADIEYAFNDIFKRMVVWEGENLERLRGKEWEWPRLVKELEGFGGVGVGRTGEGVGG